MDNEQNKYHTFRTWNVEFLTVEDYTLLVGEVVKRTYMNSGEDSGHPYSAIEFESGVQVCVFQNKIEFGNDEWVLLSSIGGFSPGSLIKSFRVNFDFSTVNGKMQTLLQLTFDLDNPMQRGDMTATVEWHLCKSVSGGNVAKHFASMFWMKKRGFVRCDISD